MSAAVTGIYNYQYALTGFSLRVGEFDVSAYDFSFAVNISPMIGTRLYS